MRTLWLHVGCHKTGSSHLQSTLAASAPRLAAHGLLYPVRTGVADGAQITVGNGLDVWRYLRWEARKGFTRVRPDLLFSSEILHSRLQDPWAVTSLTRRARAAGIDRIAFVAYVRSPVDHAASWYQQVVKRHGSTQDVVEFFDQYGYPGATVLLLERLAALGPVTVLGYDQHRRSLAPSLEEVLGLPLGTLRPPADVVVNRSLTLAELALQRSVNARLGTSGELVSDVLCQRFPEVAPEAALPPVAVQRRMLLRETPALDRLDALLPEDEALDRGTRNPPSGPGAPLEPDQLLAVVDRFVEEVGRLRGTHPADGLARARTAGVRTARRLRGGVLRRIARGAPRAAPGRGPTHG
jgi:hypothetical protein